MRHTTFIGAVVSLALLLAASEPVSGQAGLPMRGHFVWGPEVSSISPCGSDRVFWLSIPDGPANPLVVRYYELPQTEPYQRAYVEVSVWPGTGPTVGFAEDYDDVWRLAEVESLRSPGPSDCDGVAAASWLTPSQVRCEGRTTIAMVECMTAQLVLADQLLNRYTTEALGHAADTDGFMLAAQAWDHYRDIQCASVSEQWSGGSIQPLRFLGCRIALSKGRLAVIWDEYLHDSSTQLSDPTGPGDGRPN